MAQGAGESSEVTVRLRLLATTDLHVHLLPYDYYNDRAQPATGLAQAATLIRSLRAEMPEGACLLLDNGDALSGTLLSDLLAAGIARRDGSGTRRSHPMIAAMNTLGYDAGTLGNHELDHGLIFLRDALAEAAFPVVSANLLVGSGAPLVPPSILLDRALPDPDGRLHRVRIGLLGIGPPQVAAWASGALGGAVRTRDPVEATREEVARLRASGADLVVALCHSGVGGERHEPGMENAAVPIAAVPGLDALVLGHTHEVFPDPRRPASPAVDPVAGTLHGKPAVQPGFFGSHVGVIDLDLRLTPGGWAMVGHRARAVPVPAGTPVDPAVATAADSAHRALLAVTRHPVGCTRVALHSYFALLGADASLEVVADAKRAEARRLLAGRPEGDLPILCTVSPSKAGGRGGPGNYVDIPPGPLAFRQAADLYVYPNTFCLLEITGRGLRDWLERGAALFRTLTPGALDQPLLDPEAASYDFDTIDGLTWALDLSRPPRTDPRGRVLDAQASRVRDLRHGGRPVQDGDRFVLATSSYRLASGGGYSAATEARVVLQSATAARDIVLGHVLAGPVDPAPRPRWRFAPLPGTAAWFDSGPGAERHLASLGDRHVEPVGCSPEGFRRFRLRL